MQWASKSPANRGNVESSVTPTSGITLRDHYTGREDLSPDFSLPYADHAARFYAPALHRWIVPDPKSEEYYGVSVYAYCGGNPMNRVDRNGTWNTFPRRERSNHRAEAYSWLYITMNETPICKQ